MGSKHELLEQVGLQPAVAKQSEFEQHWCPIVEGTERV